MGYDKTKIDRMQAQFSDEKIAQAAWDFLRDQCLTDYFDLDESPKIIRPEITTQLSQDDKSIEGFWVQTWIWVPKDSSTEE